MSGVQVFLQPTNLLDQDEIIRVIDAIQFGDKHRIATPVNWKKGEDVIIHASVKDEEAKTLFPNYTVHLVCRFSCSHHCIKCLFSLICEPHLWRMLTFNWCSLGGM